MDERTYELLPDGAIKPSRLRREILDLHHELRDLKRRCAAAAGERTEAVTRERGAWCDKLAAAASFLQTLRTVGEGNEDVARLAEQFEVMLGAQGVVVEIPAGRYDSAMAEHVDVEDAVVGDVESPCVRTVFRPIVKIGGRVWQRGLISKLVPSAGPADEPGP